MAPINPKTVEARFYSIDNNTYLCMLCPKGCRIPIGGYGSCGSRRGEENILSACTYGKVSSIAVDPMEKKPLYHYYPGKKIFSIGSIGCNMSCRHCQNYPISQSSAGKKRTTYESPEEIVNMCRSEGTEFIAFTYNEPGIWFEYIMDVAHCDPELKIVLVSNGFINDEPLIELCSVTEAFNIDVKGFDEDFYKTVCGGDLKRVLRTAEMIFKENVHLELTYLIIPGYNDSHDEISQFTQWVVNSLSIDVPIHFTRFHPDNEMEDVPWTSEDTMRKARDIAISNGLRYVYLGNIITEDCCDTTCPKCNATVIERIGYRVDTSKVVDGKCSFCGCELNIKTK